VLLVTEDDARAQAIAKALRERKAHVGDVRAGSKDPVALRGADLLVIDARRGASTEARVDEVRSDVRARWASVATIDYATLASGDGTVDLRALEGIVSRLAGMDKALTERARKESSFETLLAPLGPTRTLRALALAGPTLHVELDAGELKATVALADELLVAAFAERDNQRWDGWTALARVLGMTDANIRVERRNHPAAMNIMEPVDQALENAAQERARAPEQFATEERSEEISGLLKQRREHAAREPVTAQAQIIPAAASSAAPRARTLVGVPPPSIPAPAAARSEPARPSTPKRESFADVPTDPAAPGLLQRMAKQPANDMLVPEIKPADAKAAPKPILPATRNDDDFDSEGNEEYDAGEVTVVADASQLDILRETLGKLEGEPKKPLTSTMPAPPGPDTGELENVEAPGDEPVLELSAPTKSAAASVFGDEESDELAAPPASEKRADQPATAAPAKAEAKPETQAPKPEAKPQAKTHVTSRPESKSTVLWWAAALLVVLAAVLFVLFGGMGGGRDKAPAAESAESE
jgi:hypothetical protein